MAPSNDSLSARAPNEAERLARRRARVLAVLLGLLVPAFAVTAYATRSFHRQQDALARDWEARAAASARAGRVNEAVDAYRTALTLRHDDREIRLGLAEALTRAGRPVEARAHLLTLHDAAPGDGLVNLELARLAAADRDEASAVRSYHDAIDGAWPRQPQQRRREVRLELAAYLAQIGENMRSQAELLPLTTEPPDDPAVRVRVAQLLAATGATERAFQMFLAALEVSPSDPAAMAGAGAAAFELANYRTARRYLARAAALDPDDQASRDRLAVVDAIVALDPFTRGLRRVSRTERVRNALSVAANTVAACAPLGASPAPAAPAADAGETPQPAQAPRSGPGGQAGQPGQTASPPTVAEAVQAAVADWSGRRRHDSDDIESAMDLVFTVEERATAACGPRRGAELALLLIGRERRASER